MTKPELKPCPFCGGSASLEEADINPMKRPYIYRYTAGCLNDGCMGYLSMAIFETEQEAAYKWNTRHD